MGRTVSEVWRGERGDVSEKLTRWTPPQILFIASINYMQIIRKHQKMGNYAKIFE